MLERQQHTRKMVTETQNLDLFSGLGQSLNQNTLECQLERGESFVCQIYREKQHTSVNEARYELFKRKLIKNKTVSLSRIPPCNRCSDYIFNAQFMLPICGEDQSKIKLIFLQSTRRDGSQTATLCGLREKYSQQQ